PEMQDEMNEIPTRLALSAKHVDQTISAARTGMARNAAYRGFLQSLETLSAGASPGGTLDAPVRVRVNDGGGLGSPVRAPASEDASGTEGAGESGAGGLGSPQRQPANE
ncbi:MAG: hypothetical protein AAGB15_15175, partial [Pseudomonadota bacterium]